MERKHNVKFFVYIIESPSADDLYSSTSERDLIAKAVSLNNIPSSLKVVVSKETFAKALSVGLYEEITKHKNILPVIHLSTHGSDEGISLTDGTVLSWSILREHFQPINKAFNGSVLLCMSSCKGYSACRMSMHPEDPDFPFWAIVGPSDEPFWSQTAVAYATFYHHLAMGQYIYDAVEAMKVASGNNNFFIITAKEAREGYVEYLKKQNAQKVLSNLEEAIGKENPAQTNEIDKIKRNLDKT